MALALMSVAHATPGPAPMPSGRALEAGFMQPPASAKPHTWWHRMNGNISRHGITADLEAMQRVGIGGLQIFDVSDSIPQGRVEYMGAEWRELTAHAVREAGRLGMEVCLHNGPGWSASGGPWITPELAMQKVVYSSRRYKGPAVYGADLEQPAAVKDYYQDILVLAFPTPAGEITDGTGFRIADWEAKAGYTSKEPLSLDMRAVPENEIIALDRVVDLTGLRKWDVPPGEWTIVRFGHTPTGVTNRQAPEGGLGLECDKLSRTAAKFHWDHFVGKILTDAGPLSGRVLNNILIDSYEVKMQNWTPGLFEHFQRLRGYDMRSYLPCLTGRVVGSLDRSERFLWDFRRTLADLFQTEYIGTFRDLCRASGLLLSIEPYGGGNFNHLEIARDADIPMGEFWTDAPKRYGWTSKLAASAAHAHGRKFVGAEAFTAAPTSAWVSHPRSMKSQGDLAFTQGINRFIFHTFVHQPWEGVLPGMTMGPHGIQGNRNNTWFEMGSAWMTYIARCQFLLQQGRASMDLCYLLSEDAPIGNSAPMREALEPAPPRGYDYDFITPETLMAMSVRNGELVLPSGMTYRALVLTPSVGMRLEVVRKIAELISAGAAVVGPRPVRSPGLENYPEADREVARLAATIPERTLPQTLKEIGLQPDALFTAPGVEYIHRRISEADVYFVTNQSGEAVSFDGDFRVSGREPELWFPDTGQMSTVPVYRTAPEGRTTVSLSLEPAGSLFVVFRRSAPADQVAKLTRDGQPDTEATLERRGKNLVLSAAKPGLYSVKTAGGRELTAKIADALSTVAVTGPWKLQFPAGWGAPESVELPQLISWTAHDHPDVKHFSGTAGYTTEFDVPADVAAAARVQLDLGRVEVVAEVILNGQPLGIAWKTPYRLDARPALRPGKNRVEIRVVNLWINRLIGDARHPDDEPYTPMTNRGKGIKKIPEWLLRNEPRPGSPRRTFSTWQHFPADARLMESGLLGPVTLSPAHEVILK